MHLRPSFRVSIALLVVVIIALFILFRLDVLSTKEPLYIAVVGPMSGEDELDGQEMVRGINMYLDQIDHEVNDRRIELLLFDDQDEADLARKRAREIAESKALVALGHNFSSTSVAGGEIYKEVGLPAISGSATAENVTAGNDWYFRVIFTNRSQATFLATYVKEVLNYETAGIIYDEDNFGSSLAENFENKFTELGGVIDNKWHFKSQGNDSLDEDLDEIVSELAAVRAGAPGTIFLATHGLEAEKIIVAMKRNNIPDVIIGADSVGDVTFGERFKTYSEEEAKPGFFLDGVYATSPIVFDVAGGKAQQFKSEFIKKYGQMPGWTAATYYDAALVAVEAIRRAGVQGNQDDRAGERARIRDHLASFTFEDKIEGLNGSIYFDQDGNVDEIELGPGFEPGADKLVDIGVYQNQNFISAWTQLEYLTSGLSGANLMRELGAGRVILDKGNPIYKTNVVYTGIDVNEVSNLDVAKSSYTVDFYLWFRYQNQFEMESLQSDDIEFVNSIEHLNLGDFEPLTEEIGRGITYRVYRIKADFKSNFDFKAYPFDTQKLEIKFRHPKLTRAKLIYAVDEIGMRQTTSEEILAKFARADVFDTIANWIPVEARFFQDVMHNESTLGNPRFVNSDATIENSRFNAVIHIKRNILFFSIKNLLPMAIILGLAYMVFFLPPSQSSSAYGIVTGALLTTAFFHLKLSSDLPGIGYVVALDLVFYFVYVLFVAELIMAIIIHREYEAENEALVRRLHKVGRVVYPLLILSSGVIFANMFIL